MARLKDFILKKTIRFFPNFFKTFSLMIIVVGLFCVFITYAYVIFPQHRHDLHYREVDILLGGDCFILSIILFLIIGKVFSLLSQSKKKKTSHIHLRLTLIFGALSAIPTVVLLLSALLFFNFGLETWFSSRVKAAIEQSKTVSIAYLKQTKELMINSALSLEKTIDENAIFFSINNSKLQDFLNEETYKLGVENAVIFSVNRGVLARSGLTFAFELDPITPKNIQDALNDGMVVLSDTTFDTVRVLLPLKNFMGGAFLVVGQFINPHILSEIRKTKTAYLDYIQAEERRSYIRFAFFLSFLMIASILLFLAIVIGEAVSNHVSRPIYSLLSVIKGIQKGDFSLRASSSLKRAKDEFFELEQAFNSMVDRIEMQQKNLWDASEQINQRREFTETLLETISTAVISLNASQVIMLANQTASRLLERPLSDMIQTPISDIFPSIAHMLQGNKVSQYEGLDQQVRVNTPTGTKVFVVKIIVKRNDLAHISEYVLTFDDMSTLFEAQKKAAWQNIARRIAHDIKNPLTPIQLATERLRRNYMEKKKTDMTIFSECTETIIRQVESIQSLVDDFSSFARMPVPKRQKLDLIDICKKDFFLQKHAHSDVSYDISVPNHEVYISCDRYHLSQLFTNIFQNAYEAVYERMLEEPFYKGKISLEISEESDKVKVVIQDNGSGIALDDKPYITDPYMTTKEKGTGLGLAIVLKIVNDHNGSLFFNDVEGGGTSVCVQFNKI